MVNWNAEKDQVLLKGVFAFCDIKSSTPLLAYLAEEIGGNCTPKAVSHRLNNIRKSGKPAGTPNGTPAKMRIATPIKKSPVKTPRGQKKKVTTPTPTPESRTDEGGPSGLLNSDGDDDEVLSPSMNRQRARSMPKKSYVESEQEEDEEEEYIPFGQRVKTEPKDDDVALDQEEV